MPDSNNNGGAQPPANGDQNNGGNGAPDPSKTGQQPPTFDPSKISDADLPKILEDKRLWDHPRMKELRENANKAKQLEADRQKAEEENLTKNKQFEELATKKGQEAETWKTRYQQAQVNNAIFAEAAKIGVIDPAAAARLIDQGKVKVDDDGNVTGVAEALEALKTTSPYLFGKVNSQQPVGGGSNPPNDERVPGTFKMSEVQNTEFYAAHEKEIKEAMKNGKIIDDR